MEPQPTAPISSKKTLLEKLSPSNKVSALIAIAIFALGVYTLLHLTTGRAATTPILYEAESFSLPTGSAISSDSTTSAGQYVGILRNGAITKSITLDNPATEIAIKARGSNCAGNANFTLSVNGKSLTTKTVSTSWSSYSQTVNLPAGAHTLSIAFTNDYSARKCDRNLYIDTVSLLVTDSTKTTPSTSALPVVVPFKLASGSASLTDWSSDGGYTGGNTANYAGTVALGTSTAPEALYRNERYGAFQYSFSGLDPAKVYSIKLHFIESYVSAKGQRVFNVTINGSSILTNFDIFAEAGGKGIALVKSFSFSPDASGNALLNFIPGAVDNPKICGIEIDLASSSTSTTPTPTPSTTPTPQKILRSATFDDLALSDPISPSAFNIATGGTNTNPAEYDDTSIVDDSRGTGKVIRTRLDANTIRSTPSGNNGAVLFPPIPSVDNACISYDIKFDSKFDFSLGGKLPGLEGVVQGTSPSDPTGGHYTEMGWSGRMMWLGPKAYSWAGPVNMAVSYMYHYGQSDIYGDNVLWNKAFAAGTWHTVKQCYVMNTPGVADGVLQAWFDGVQVLDRHNFVYRSSSRPDLHINYINWSIFRGGGDLTWASPTVGYIDIDNLLITTQ